MINLNRYDYMLLLCFFIYLIFFLYIYINFKKLNYAYLYSNNINSQCNNKIEKYKTRFIQFSEIHKLNIINFNKTIYFFSIILITIISIRLLAIFWKIFYRIFNNKYIILPNDKFKFIIIVLNICFINLISLIPIIYIYIQIYNNYKDLLNVVNIYQKYILDINELLLIKNDKIYHFDINETSDIKLIELFKYIILKRILYIENLGSYEEAKNVYTDKFNIIKKGNLLIGAGLIEYIDFNKNSIDYKLLKKLLCSNDLININDTINEQNVDEIISDYLNYENKNSQELNIIDKLNNQDFNTLSTQFKKIYLYNQNFDNYKKYIINTISSLNISDNHKDIIITYFNNLDKNNTDWKIWQTLNNTNNLFKLFNNLNCNGDALKNIDNNSKKNMIKYNNTIYKLSLNEPNNIDLILKKYVNNIFIALIIVSCIPFFMIFNFIYKKYDKQKTILIFTVLLIIYIIEEVIRINFIQFQ